MQNVLTTMWFGVIIEVLASVRTLSVKWMCNIKCTEPINVCCVYRWTWPYFN